jgi:hypothetical protein
MFGIIFGFLTAANVLVISGDVKMNVLNVSWILLEEFLVCFILINFKVDSQFVVEHVLPL